MDRLTFEGNFCDIAQCLEMRGGKHCPDGYCSQRRVWERLKEYEDTGLEPKEIESALDGATREFMAYDELGHIDHLQKLVMRDTPEMCGEQFTDHGIDVSGERYVEYYFTCPHCGAAVGDAEYNELNGPFCSQCGQRLKIRDDADEITTERENKDDVAD